MWHINQHIKHITKTSDQSAVRREIEIMRRVGCHPNIVGLRDVFEWLQLQCNEVRRILCPRKVGYERLQTYYLPQPDLPRWQNPSMGEYEEPDNGVWVRRFARCLAH